MLSLTTPVSALARPSLTRAPVDGALARPWSVAVCGGVTGLGNGLGAAFVGSTISGGFAAGGAIGAAFSSGFGGRPAGLVVRTSTSVRRHEDPARHRG